MKRLPRRRSLGLSFPSALLFCWLLALPLCAQIPAHVTLTCSQLQDDAGNLLAGGTLVFTPVLTPGSTAPAIPHVGSGGRALPLPVTFNVTNGVCAPAYGNAQLLDVTQASPQNICYQTQATDNNSGDSWQIDSCLQPAYNASWCSLSSGVTTCDYDNYVAPGSAGALVANAVMWQGAWSSGTYGLDQGVFYNGSSYVCVAIGCSTTPPGSGWQIIAQQGGTGSTGSTGATGATGPSGNTIWNGTGSSAPSNSIGANGDFFLSTTTDCLYGPKVSGAWPGGCTSLVGATGSTGAAGAAGATGPAGAAGGSGIDVPQLAVDSGPVIFDHFVSVPGRTLTPDEEIGGLNTADGQSTYQVNGTSSCATITSGVLQNTCGFNAVANPVYINVPNTTSPGGTPGTISTASATLRFCAPLGYYNSLLSGAAFILQSPDPSGGSYDEKNSIAHLSFGPRSWGIETRDGSTDTTFDGGTYQGDGLQVDCHSQYQVSYEFNSSASTLKLHLPDGETRSYQGNNSSAAACTSGYTPGCYVNFSASGLTNPVDATMEISTIAGAAIPEWTGVSLGGPSQAQKTRAAGSGAPEAGINDLYGSGGTAKATYTYTIPSQTQLAAITAVTGGTITGASYCPLTTFNGGGSGATGEVYFPTAGSYTGAVFSVLSVGNSYGSAPTSATYGSPCSGTPTLTTVLGGAGNYPIGIGTSFGGFAINAPNIVLTATSSTWSQVSSVAVKEQCGAGGVVGTGTAAPVITQKSTWWSSQGLTSVTLSNDNGSLGTTSDCQLYATLGSAANASGATLTVSYEGQIGIPTMDNISPDPTSPPQYMLAPTATALSPNSYTWPFVIDSSPATVNLGAQGAGKYVLLNAGTINSGTLGADTAEGHAVFLVNAPGSGYQQIEAAYNQTASTTAPICAMSLVGLRSVGLDILDQIHPSCATTGSGTTTTQIQAELTSAYGTSGVTVQIISLDAKPSFTPGPSYVSGGSATVSSGWTDLTTMPGAIDTNPADQTAAIQVPSSFTTGDVAGFAATGQLQDLHVKGNGGYVQQTTSASPTANDLAKFDSNGNVVDSGISSTSASAGTTLCAMTSPATGITGNTSEQNIYVCTVPSGTMGANSRLQFHSFAGNASGNTGSCTITVRWTATSGSTSSGQLGVNPSATGASRNVVFDGHVVNGGSTSQQYADVVSWGSGTYTNHASNTLSTGSAASYLNFNTTNSAAGDTCTLYNVWVEIWPNG